MQNLDLTITTYFNGTINGLSFNHKGSSLWRTTRTYEREGEVKAIVGNEKGNTLYEWTTFHQDPGMAVVFALLSGTSNMLFSRVEEGNPLMARLYTGEKIIFDTNIYASPAIQLLCTTTAELIGKEVTVIYEYVASFATPFCISTVEFADFEQSICADGICSFNRHLRGVDEKNITVAEYRQSIQQAVGTPFVVRSNYARDLLHRQGFNFYTIHWRATSCHQS